MVELPVKNTNKKLIVTEEQYEKIKDYKIKIISRGNHKKYIMAYNDTATKAVLGMLYDWYGVGPRRVVYLDGNEFNLQPNNIKAVDVIRCKSQKINDKDNTITVGEKTYKFDKEDFEIAKTYTLCYDSKRDVVRLNKSKTKNHKAECRAIKAVLFPTEERMSLRFKNGDSTDYRRNNLEIINYGSWRKIAKRPEEKFIGVTPTGGLYRVVVTNKQKIAHSVALECSKIEAGAVYNYLRRQVGNIKILNETGYTTAKEDEIAIRILKNNVREPVHKHKKGSSKYLGVSFFKEMNNWMCRATIGGTHYYLGLHDTEIEAAKAYNKKAVEILGDKATLNKIDE